MSLFVTLLIWTILLAGCQSRASSVNGKSDAHDADTPMTSVVFKYETGSPNIGIGSYTLISKNAEAQRADADAVMRVKKSFPLAVQTKDRAVFEEILARDFIFQGEGGLGLLRREDYINDRTNPSGGKVLTAHFENITLQFFDDIAVMTYRNIVKGTNANGQPDPPEYISWADIYVREDGNWKIGSVHVIDYRTGSAHHTP